MQFNTNAPRSVLNITQKMSSKQYTKDQFLSRLEHPDLKKLQIKLQKHVMQIMQSQIPQIQFQASKITELQVSETK